MITDQQIVQTFEQYPYENSPQQWVETVTKQLVTTTQPQPFHSPKIGSQLYAFVSPVPQPISAPTAILLEFSRLYTEILLSQTDEFTIPSFKQFISDLTSFRLRYKADPAKAAINANIKAYLNSLFGQLNTGYVRHASVCAEDIVQEGYRVAKALFDHPMSNALYADTDQVVFALQTHEQVTAVVNDLGITYPYTLHDITDVNIVRPKHASWTYVS